MKVRMSLLFKSLRLQPTRGSVGFFMVLPATLILACIIVINGCATNAATGERQFNLISESREIAMGQDADKAITAQMGLYPDSALQVYVRNLGMEMAKRSERPNLPWSFKVVNDPVVNAFALPGGFIYVTRGILSHLNSEAELAGVLGHEIGHVTGKHSVAQMSTQQIAQLGLGVTMIVEPSLQRFANIASTGLGLLFLKYGRDDENQADALGVRYMTGINHDPREMIRVMETLDAVTSASGSSGPPEWLSTHPNPGNRAQRISAQVDTMTGDLSRTEVNRDVYLQKIDGMVFGENPRDGFFQGSTFYHPDMAFRFDFPGGWKTANQMQGVVGVSAEQNAMIQLTLAPGTSQSAAASQFFGQQGLTSGGTQSANLNGIPVSWGRFSAQTDQGEIQGSAYFYSYGGRVFQILAYGTPQGWSSNEQAATNSARSFSKLTDQKILSVKPWKLDVITLTEPMTIEQFAQKYKTPVNVETLALINNADTNTRFIKGNKLKTVVGEPLPGNAASR